MLAAIPVLPGPSSAAAQDPRPASFLLEPTGARALGVGSAVTALADDVSALRANPAGLPAIDDYQGAIEIGTTHARDPWGHASFAVPFQRRTTFAFGVGGTRLNSELQRTRLGNDYAYRTDAAARDEEQGVAEMAVGRLLRPDLGVGVGARYTVTRTSARGSIYEGVYGSVGLRYNSAQTGIVAGVVFENFGGRLSGAADPDLPWTLRAGLSYGLMFRTAHYLNTSLDVVKMRGEDVAVRAGVEYWFANYLALRAGYDGLADRADANPYGGRIGVGLTLNFRGVLYDLTFVPAKGDLRDARLAIGARLSLGEARDNRP